MSLKKMTKSKKFIPTRSSSESSVGQTLLSIDPGFDRVGLALMTVESSKPKLLFSECLETDPKTTHSERLLTIGERVRNIIEEWQPTTLAIETLFFNTNTTSAMGVAEARGVIVYEATRSGLEICEYGPQSIKIAVTGYGRASKAQVAEMLKRLINLPKLPNKRLDDEMDAIALGITHLATKNGI